MKIKSVKLRRIWVPNKADTKRFEFFEVLESKNVTGPLPGDRLSKAEFEQLVRRGSINVTIVSEKKS